MKKILNDKKEVIFEGNESEMIFWAAVYSCAYKEETISEVDNSMFAFPLNKDKIS